ncbi:unnamed protein product [Brassica oleracea]
MKSQAKPAEFDFQEIVESGRSRGRGLIGNWVTLLVNEMYQAIHGRRFPTTPVGGRFLADCEAYRMVMKAESG